MENQDNGNTVPQQDIQSPDAQNPSPEPVQPAQPIEQTPPVGAVNLPVAPPASVENTGSNSQPPSTEPINIPSEWPGAFKIYKISKAAVKFNMDAILGLSGIGVGVFVVYFIVHAILKSLNRSILQIPFDLIYFMVYAAIIYACLESIKGNKTTYSKALSAAGKKWVSILITSILVEIMVIISAVLFIIPFFFVFPRLALALYYVIDQNMGPMDAIKASWEHTKGNVGKVYGIVGVFILIVIPSITIIGILATIYFGFMYYAAYAILYSYIISKKSSAPAAAPTPPSVNPAPAPS